MPPIREAVIISPRSGLIVTTLLYRKSNTKQPIGLLCSTHLYKRKVVISSPKGCYCLLL